MAVDYTEVKNIRKTGDLKPGMVLYEKYETAYITPDPSLMDKLRKGNETFRTNMFIEDKK